MSSKRNYNVEFKKSAVELMNVIGYTLPALSEVNLLGDGAYESDPLRRYFQNQGWVLLSPPREPESTGPTMAKGCDAMPSDGSSREQSVVTPLQATGHAGTITQISSMSSSN